jgi:hypothetical protein
VKTKEIICAVGEIVFIAGNFFKCKFLGGKMKVSKKPSFEVVDHPEETTNKEMDHDHGTHADNA